MKIYKNKIPHSEYSKIVNDGSIQKYEVNVKLLKPDEMIQCPYDDDTFISGIQEDGSVICEIAGGKIEKS